MSEPQTERYYTAAEAARVLGMKLGMFHYHVRHGRLDRVVPPMRKTGMYRKEQVDALAQELQAFYGAGRK